MAPLRLRRLASFRARAAASPWRVFCREPYCWRRLLQRLA